MRWERRTRVLFHSLLAVLARFTVVYLCASSVFVAVAIQDEAIEAAQTSGVNHINHVCESLKATD